MKRALVFLFLAQLIIGSSFFSGRVWKQRQKEKEDKEDQGFRPTAFPLYKNSFVIVLIASDCQSNNDLEKALNSIASQTYEHLRVFYIDAGGVDKDHKWMQEIFSKNGKREMIQFINLQETQTDPRTLIECALQNCCDEEIVVILQKGEYLAHEWVLSRLNQYYEDPDLWMTFSQTCSVPSYQIKKNTYSKEEPFVFQNVPLKTFRAGPFKKETEEIGFTHRQFIPEVLSLIQEKPD